MEVTIYINRMDDNSSLTNGDNNRTGVHSPKAQMTRAEVAALIERMLKVTNLIDK